MLTTPIRLIDSAMIGRNARRLRFVRSDGGTFAYRPGEFVSLHLPGENGEPYKRSYSIATIAENPAAAETLDLVLASRTRRRNRLLRSAWSVGMARNPGQTLAVDRYRHRCRTLSVHA